MECVDAALVGVAVVVRSLNWRPQLASVHANDSIRYELDEPCPPFVAIGVGVQGILVVLAPVVLVVAINVLAGGQGESSLAWSVFAALIIVGVVTALQAARIGRIGGGHFLIAGVTPNYIAVSVLALAEGGPAMLATLIVVSSFFYVLVAVWLPMLRRIITPVVTGTVLMLIAAMVLPFAFDRLQEVPEGAPRAAGLCSGAVTLIVSAILVLRASKSWRPWSLLVGIATGCITAAMFGIYDVKRVVVASWIGVPDARFPGLDLTPTTEFGALLVMFLIVTLVHAIKGVGDSAAVQQVSRRRPQATDFRLIQGSIYANGVGILLSGIAGTPPTSSYLSFTVPFINLTGVTVRRVGYIMGGLLVVLAFFPKVTGALLTIPSPVMGGFLLVALGMVFVEGIRTLVRAGLDAQKAIVVGLAVVTGFGVQHHNVLEEVFGSPWGKFLGNGMIIGTATAIALTAFLELTSRRRQRMEVQLDNTSFSQIDVFLQGVAARISWDTAATERLRSAGEEALASMLQLGNEYPAGKAPRLIVAVRPEGEAVEMEFLAVIEDENLENRLTYLNEQAEILDETEISFRLLRHYASSVRHQKYHGLDIVTVKVTR